MNTKTYQRKTQQQTNQLFFWFVLGLYAIGLALAPFHQTWEIAIGVGTSCLILFLATSLIFKTAFFTHNATGVVFAVFAWQFSYQLKYIHEASHFYFIGAAALILYQDARVFVPYMLMGLIWQTSTHQQINNTTWFTSALMMSLMLVINLLCAWIAYTLRSKNRKNYETQLKTDEKLKALETSLDWIIHISEGELTHANDQLLHGIAGSSRLIEMKNRLGKAKALEEKEKFANSGLAQISEVVSDHDYDLEDLSSRLLNKIVTYFEAQQGSFYLLEDTDEGEMLVLKGAYACNPEKENRHILGQEEGFIGQAMKERITLQMHDIPAHYFKITSGLGSILPKMVIVVPIQTTEDVVGVIELATLNPLEPYKIDLLEKMAETIASSILSIKFNDTTANLLLESRQLATRLQAQEDEIRQHLEQMHLNNEEAEGKIKGFLKELQEKEIEIQRLKKTSSIV